MHTNTSSWFPIRDKCHFFLHGNDAERYLNGQVTNNIKKLATNHTLSACLLTPKGKLCALLTISRSRFPLVDGTEAIDGFLIESDLVLQDVISNRLERYIVADDAHLTDLTGKFYGLHLLSPEEKISQSIVTPLVIHQHSRLATPGYDIWFPNIETAKSLQLDPGAELSSADIEHERIRLGTPKWGHELSENTLPAEVGLDKTAIDFHKGCYLGQEVISRIQSIGHVNHHLVPCHWENEDLTSFPLSIPLFSDAATAKDSTNAKPVGKITSISPNKNAKIGLAIIHRSVSDATELFAAENKEHPKRILRIEISHLARHNNNDETL
ncbi:MAG: YgfZ/GcvT domain-containing protein [Chthoniobacterales bacterium]